VAPARDHGFHPVRVKRVVHETADTRSFVLDVPLELRSAFAYDAGQFCTFRVPIGGELHLRSYSMSSSPEVDEELQVTVKRVADGVVSNWMIDELAPGACVDVTCPAGVFRLGGLEREVVAFAGGSGITPVFSILKTALMATGRKARLFYANRDRDAVIFGDELAAMLSRFAERLQVTHHLDADRGLVEGEEVREFTGGIVDADFFVCGPTPFMDTVEAVLLADGVAADRIHIERFAPLEPPLPAVEAPAGTQVTVELDGRVETVTHRPGMTILQTARQVGLSPPFSCEAGSCATCMARLVSGTVDMRVNDALTEDEVGDGWILTCQAVPTAPAVRVLYGYEGS
jgi:3-ketosteroid 9alpha-monooxygenase subunit B